MASADGISRHRSALSALDPLDMGKVARSNVDRPHKPTGPGLTISTAPLLSPTMTYPGPPQPFSCSSAATAVNFGASDYISPPISRRTTVDDKATGQRQSLPSIHEALGGDSSIPFSGSNVGHPLLAGARSNQQTTPFRQGQSLPEAPSGPLNPFSQNSAPGQASENDHHPPRHTKVQDTPIERDGSKSAFPSINATDPIPPSLHTFDVKPPKTRSTYPIPSNPYQQSPHSNSCGPSAATSPNNYPPYRSPFLCSADSSNPPSSNIPPAADYSRFNTTFKFDDRKQPVPRSHPVQPYSDSVKRHLDIFDIEMALNEVSEGSSRALEFSRLWSQRAFQRQKAGQLPESFPSLAELDDLVRQSGRVGEAFSRIKEAVIAQQQALAEEQARALKHEHYEGDVAGFPGEFKDNGGFASGDSKKRRGKAAPPGRCHSCNRAETPEWRRGPDGARTLCNACGLHYAKLTRKMAINKTAALSGSNLRPKNAEAHSAM